VDVQSEDSDDEEDIIDTVSSKDMPRSAHPSLPEKAIPSAVGTALKGTASVSDTFTGKKKKKTKLSWRERLNSMQKIPNEEQSESSESDEMSSGDDSEYSDWDGFSGKNSADDAGSEAADDDESEHSDDGSEASEDEEEPETDNYSSESNDDTEDVRRRAKDFKNWARDQSGLGDSMSNISSLPQLLPEQRQAVMTAMKKQEEPPESVSTNAKPQQVNR
jgi:hypothetical protein